MNTLAGLVLQRAQMQWRELDAHIAWCDQRIASHVEDNDAVKKAATLWGIGPVTASAAVATVGEFKQFRTGAQFGAWIGLVQRQHSSGGKNSLGGITKRGDTYLRSLLIQAAKAAVMTAHRRSDPISRLAAAACVASGLAAGQELRLPASQQPQNPEAAAAHTLADAVSTRTRRATNHTSGLALQLWPAHARHQTTHAARAGCCSRGPADPAA